MSLDPHSRVLLSGILYRATMRAFGAELARRDLPPPRPEEKMALHRLVEERAWALPDAVAASVEGRDVDDGVDDLPVLADEARRLARDAVAARG